MANKYQDIINMLLSEQECHERNMRAVDSYLLDTIVMHNEETIYRKYPMKYIEQTINDIRRTEKIIADISAVIKILEELK